MAASSTSINSGSTSPDAAEPARVYARFAAAFDPADLPASTMLFQKKRVLDNLGAMLAGRGAAGHDALLALAVADARPGGATVIGADDRLPAASAAFLNSYLARSLDYCDVIPPGWHPSSSDVAAALAVGEAVGAGGAEVLTALALGQDFAQRVNRASGGAEHAYFGFDPNLLAALSVAVVAGRLLGLDADRMADAIGLAFNAGCGTFQAYQDKVLAVRVGQADATRAAFAYRARAGLTGVRRPLAGPYGLFAVYGRGAGAAEMVTDDLGGRFHGEDVTIFKLFPSCGLTLALTDAALRLHAAGVRGAGAGADGVADVEVVMSATMDKVCGQAYEPGPTPEVDAAFSVQYVAASALARGHSVLADFTPVAATAPDIVAQARAVRRTVDAGFGTDECELRVVLGDGRRRAEHARFGLGFPENPASYADLTTKFQDCAAYAAPAMTPARADRIAESIQTLDTQPSVSALLALCGPRAASAADRSA